MTAVLRIPEDVTPIRRQTYVTRGGYAPQPDQKFGARSWMYRPETIANWLASRRRGSEEAE